MSLEDECGDIKLKSIQYINNNPSQDNEAEIN